MRIFQYEIHMVNERYTFGNGSISLHSYEMSDLHSHHRTMNYAVTMTIII